MKRFPSCYVEEELAGTDPSYRVRATRGEEEERGQGQDQEHHEQHEAVQSGKCELWKWFRSALQVEENTMDCAAAWMGSKICACKPGLAYFPSGEGKQKAPKKRRKARQRWSPNGVRSGPGIHQGLQREPRIPLDRDEQPGPDEPRILRRGGERRWAS